MIPADNVKDLREIPDNVKNGLELIPVVERDGRAEDALVRMPEPIDWDEAAEAAAAAAAAKRRPGPGRRGALSAAAFETKIPARATGRVFFGGSSSPG